MEPSVFVTPGIFVGVSDSYELVDDSLETSINIINGAEGVGACGGANRPDLGSRQCLGQCSQFFGMKKRRRWDWTRRRSTSALTLLTEPANSNQVPEPTRKPLHNGHQCLTSSDGRPSRYSPSVRFTLLAQFDGRILDVATETFTVLLHDKMNDALDEAAEIDLAEVPACDREYVVPGGLFRLLIGYEDRPTRTTVTRVLIRRLPLWTDSDKAAARSWVDGVASALGLDGQA